MESTSEVVYDEQTKSSVSAKKCIQEVSTTTMQKKSSSSLVAEKSVMSILGSDDSLVGNQITSIPNVESSIALPLISRPFLPEDGITASLQSEFSAMKLKDDYGNEIGELVQQKHHQQSVQGSSSVTSVGNISKGASSLTEVSSSTTLSSKMQQSIKSVVAECQESLSSVSCSSFSSTKKQEIISSSERSLSSVKSSQSIEKVMSSSIAVAEDQEF